MPQVTSGRLALAVSSLALVVAMGGATYAAATIGTAQLKKNAVTSVKIKNNQVTGKDVKESSLAKVPAAGQADTAGSAGSVNGFTPTEVNYRVTSGGTTSQVLFSGGGLTITATCIGSTDDISIAATTTKAGSFISSYVSTDSTPEDPFEDDLDNSGFDPADSFDLLAGGSGNGNRAEFNYSSADGSTVFGQLVTDEISPDCFASGVVFLG